MEFQQFLNFEITSACDMANVHRKCPNTHPERYANVDTSQELTDEAILSVAKQAYREHGFRGLVGWHYYNEPLLKKERIFRLMHALRKDVPEARFQLWTNGNLIPKDCTEFKIFEQIHITNYHNKSFSRVKAVVPNTTVLKGQLDARRNVTGMRSRRPCVRPYIEMDIDHFGNVHMCCMDWKGLIKVGNIMKQPFTDVLARFTEIRAKVSGNEMHKDAPEACLTCQLRFAELDHFMPTIARAAHMSRGWELHKHLPIRNPAVTLTSYKVPTHRLNEHFEWNDKAYRETGVKVYVVTDQEYDVPDYAKCVVFKEEMPVFNLARTSNAGIEYAIAQGHEVIVKSDVDVCFPPEALGRMVRCRDNEALIALYLMSANYEERKWNYIEAPKAEGTIAMTAEAWKNIKYDVRCVGYGAEDGIVVHAITTTIRDIGRDPLVWHIAHNPNSEQTEFKGRTDHWNRDTGFNPDALKKNVKFHPKKARKARQTNKAGRGSAAARRKARRL